MRLESFRSHCKGRRALLSSLALATALCAVVAPCALATPQDTTPQSPAEPRIPRRLPSDEFDARPDGAVERDTAAPVDPSPDPEVLATPHLGKNVTAVRIEGNLRTRTRFIERLLTVAQGAALEPGAIARSVKNLKNTKLFKRIDVEFAATNENDVVLVVRVEELWTTIPVLLFSTGGGSVLVLVGIVETNLFGNGALSYLTYQYLDGTNTWTGQVKYPDFLDSGLEMMPYFWLEEKNNEIRTYDPDKTLLGGFTSHQQTFGTTVRRPNETGRPWMPLVTPGLGARYSKWHYSEEELSAETKEENRRNGYLPPDTTRRFYVSPEISFGRVDFDGNLADGATLLYRFTHGSPLSSGSSRFQEHFVIARFFHTFPYETLIAARFEWQQRESDTAGDEDMLGGLFHVRGLPNDIFRGLTLWMLNLEARRIVLRQKYVHWQAVAFTDAGDTGRTRTQKEIDYRPSGAAWSAGGGVRVLFPDISELAVRIDYGWLLSPFRASGLSLGLVQFVR